MSTFVQNEVLDEAWIAQEMQVSSEAAARAAQFLESEDWFVREAAVKALGRFRLAAAPYTASLVQRLKDNEASVRHATLEALGVIRGPQTATYGVEICRMLADDDYCVRRAVKGVLAQLVPGVSTTAASELLILLGHPELQVRELAAEACSVLGPAAAQHAAMIAAYCDLPQWQDRESAARMLSLMGAAAAPQAPTLARLLADSQAHVRAAAVHALGRIGPVAAAHASALTSRLADEEGYVREAAVEALSHVGGEQAAIEAAVVMGQAAKAREAVATSVLYDTYYKHRQGSKKTQPEEPSVHCDAHLSSYSPQERPSPARARAAMGPISDLQALVGEEEAVWL